MNRKVLILSIGTGKKAEGDYPYSTAAYRFGDEGKIIESPFVAEALIEKIQPELIIVVGTVKSAWDAFYLKYHKEMEDFQKPWKDIEKRIAMLDKDSDDSDVMNFQNMLNMQYAEDLVIKGNPKVEVCLIPYGLTEDDLRSSYRKISGCLRDSLKGFGENDSIEISFDITHSFRSIPIYNLVVIDYCRLLLSQNIKIKHVFYGNLDVARENNNIAQIVDLKDIVDILETTRGISEFHNTGNATTFLSRYPLEEQDEFIQQLRRFQSAMQMNNRGAIQSTLEKLLRMELQGDSDALMDAKATIKEKLQKEIPDLEKDCEDAIERQISKAKFQIHLAVWCLKHGQIGLASAIAKEGFRSFLVAIYENDTAKYEDEKARRRAEQIFASLIKKTFSNELFKEYSEIENKARLIRNMYAHNLEMLGNEPSDYMDDEQIIRKYINVIREIMLLERAAFVMKEELSDAPIEKKNITFFISNLEFSPEDIVKLSGKDGVLYQLTGNFFSKEKDRVRMISQLIARELEDLLGKYSGDTDVKVMWGTDIASVLSQNASCFIKAYISEKNIHILKWRESKMEPLKMDFVWKIDLEDECSQLQREVLEERRKMYTLRKLN